MPTHFFQAVVKRGPRLARRPRGGRGTPRGTPLAHRRASRVRGTGRRLAAGASLHRRIIAS
ncbi:hypothetical protein GSH07_12810 [Burkholderia pseudomallei]|uniref:hypothetical protein n=1 Tax=Burkholderia pseudomallei TaxID=28450 RepID=UPI0009B1C3AB|nr:hypothetical protein [Burkholderia pseudomallei]MBM5665939.1 hypothetical protein [Burkholderia pseudomallei]